MDAIQAFAGPNVEEARHYPEDELFLLERPCSVEHPVVEAGHMEMVP